MFVLTSLWSLGFHASASPARRNGTISERRDVPSDPLAGIPEEDASAPGRKAGSQDKNTVRGKTCKLEIVPESDEKIGDLRAALAVIQHGPTGCPAPSAAAPVRLRLSIDATGKITAVDALAGDPKFASMLSRRLTGKRTESRIRTATEGVARISVLRR
jgi:hypothetical protein